MEETKDCGKILENGKKTWIDSRMGVHFNKYCKTEQAKIILFLLFQPWKGKKLK